MAFSVADFQDLVRLLDEKPEWRAELRRLVLTEELLSLPDALRRLTLLVEQLAEAQQRTEARLEQLTTRVEQLAQEVGQLASSVSRLVDLMGEVREAIASLQGGLGDLRGWRYEEEYRRHIYAHFGRFLRGLRLYDTEGLSRLLEEAEDRGLITHDNSVQVMLADAVFRARRKETDEDVHGVAEISETVDMEEIQRAYERASILGRIFSPTIPIVAGRITVAGAGPTASNLGVWQVTGAAVVPPSNGSHPA